MDVKAKKQKKSSHLYDLLWDLWCFFSVIGIWPRFIEPNLISTTQLKLSLPNLPPALKGFRILQFSDLHLNDDTPHFFLNKLLRKVKKLQPDLIVFTGDFLCFSRPPDEARLKRLLKAFDAPCGCYAILGNHDYLGQYNRISRNDSLIGRGFRRLFSTKTSPAKAAVEEGPADPHPDLINLLKETPFQLLHNESVAISVGDATLNLCGLGEHMAGRCQPTEAFKNYDCRHPGIILAHNPDAIAALSEYPGEIILCGHTHGGEVNFPWLWKKLVALENCAFKRGLFRREKRWIYVNRGIGGILPFRWFSTPEILLLTLE